MHGSHKMFYFERKKSCGSFDVFIHENLSTTIFFFLADFLTVFFFGKALAIVTKHAVLDLAGILNPIQYAQTWIECANKLVQVPNQR